MTLLKRVHARLWWSALSAEAKQDYRTLAAQGINMKQLKPVTAKQLKPATARPLLVTAYYTGDNGTYCSVLPTSETVERINAFQAVLQEHGFLGHSPLNYHVTVIHSKTGMPLREQQDAWAMMKSDRLFEAVPKHVTHWSGHNDVGYIVLELDSPQLSEIHEFLKTTFDLETSFPDYKCHLTLVEDAYSKSDEDNMAVQEVVNKLNQMIGMEPPPMTFNAIRIEDLKAD